MLRHLIYLERQEGLIECLYNVHIIVSADIMLVLWMLYSFFLFLLHFSTRICACFSSLEISAKAWSIWNLNTICCKLLYFKLWQDMEKKAEKSHRILLTDARTTLCSILFCFTWMHLLHTWTRVVKTVQRFGPWQSRETCQSLKAYCYLFCGDVPLRNYSHTHLPLPASWYWRARLVVVEQMNI